MLNSDEITKLITLFAGASNHASSIVEHNFVPRDVMLDGGQTAELVFEEHPAEQSSPMRVPDFVLGTPVDPTCLSGIGEYQFQQPPHRVRRYRNVRVIGWRATLTAEGELFCGRPVTTQADFDVVIRNANSGFEGFIAFMHEGRAVACHRRPGRTVRMPGVGLFLGMLEQGNYGSFMFRGLPQVLFAGELPISIDYLIVGERTSWIMSALSALGLDKLPIFTASEIYGSDCEELLVVDEIDGEAFIDELSLGRIRRFAERCVSHAGRSAHSAPEKLYISRALSTNRAPFYRVLTNEREIEDTVRTRGFQVVYPEVFTLVEQCVLFHRARAIMGPSGSGMLNAVFAPEGAKLADLEVFTYTVRQHAKLYSSSGKSYGFVFGETSAGHPHQRMFAAWKVEPSLVADAVDLITT
jgi:hypothetical protein